MKNASRWLACLFFLISCADRHQVVSPTLVVAAAADLAPALDAGKHAAEQATGAKISFSYGSSGILAQQIVNGLAVDIFMAADQDYARQAVESGQCEAASLRIYAQGVLVWFTSHPELRELLQAPERLTDPRFKHVAIADPRHAPYGRAARAYLQNIGVWPAVEPKIVIGPNVRQALQHAQNGAVEAALTARSLVANEPASHIVELDTELYPPLQQTLVVCRGSGNRVGAHKFVEFISGDAGRALMQRFGFIIPKQ